MSLKQKDFESIGNSSNTNCTSICTTDICIPFPSYNYNEQLIESTLRWFYRVTSMSTFISRGPGWLSWYSDSVQARRFGDRFPVTPIFSTSIQTVPGAHTALYVMDTVSFLEYCGRDVALTTHHI